MNFSVFIFLGNYKMKIASLRSFHFRRKSNNEFFIFHTLNYSFFIYFYSRFFLLIIGVFIDNNKTCNNKKVTGIQSIADITSNVGNKSIILQFLYFSYCLIMVFN